MASIVLLPTMLFALIFGIVLMTRLKHGLKWYANQKMHAIVNCAVDLWFYICIGTLQLVMCRGLPWLGFSGVCVHQHGDVECKTIRFLRSTATSSLTTFLLLTTLNRTLIVHYCGQFPPSASKTMTFICILISVILAIPDLAVMGLWRLDGRLFCGTEANLPRLVILAVELHRFLLVDGFFQCILTTVVLILLCKSVRRLDNTINLLYASSATKENISEVAFEICEVLRNIRRGSRFVLRRSSILSALFAVRALLGGIVSMELYYFQRAKRTQARLILYTLLGIQDIVSVTILIVTSFDYWFFYYHYPTVRSSNDTNANGEWNNHKYIMPPYPDPHSILDRWKHLLEFVKKFDLGLYHQLVSLRVMIEEVAAQRLNRYTQRLNEFCKAFYHLPS
ncbi:unnamed protein product [Dicrocoelium dendriticum]|nr:unnamed protein product [Dicrocoelium dendriticum]